MKNLVLIFLIYFLVTTKAYAEIVYDCTNLTDFYDTAVEHATNFAEGDFQEALCRKLGKSQKKLNEGKIAEAIQRLNRYIIATERRVGKLINQPTADIMTTEANRLIAILEGNMNLPPDPGEAGKQTLAGIDSDGDGVRDDIQRYLALTITDSQRFLKYQTMDAKYLQGVFDVYQDKQASRDHFHNPARRRCFYYITRTYDVDIDVWTGFELVPQMMNTKERTLAYIQYERHLSPSKGPRKGEYDMAFWKTECDFDPDALAN